MEETKNEKRKPFNADQVKVGDVVETRNGRECRIICTDYKSENKPIIGLVLWDDREETAYQFTKDGHTVGVFDCPRPELDLFFPLREYTRFVKIYRLKDGKITTDGQFFETEEQAAGSVSKAEEKSYLTTAKITFKA